MPMRIAGDVYHHALLGVGLLLRQGFGLVRYFTALHNPLSSRPRSVSSHDLRMRSRLRIMVLNIYVGRDKRLPDSIQVGFAIRRMGRPVGWELTGCRNAVLSGGRRLTCHGFDGRQD